MNLEELVPGVYLENGKIECKSLLNRDDVIGWLKTIAGFANAEGGEFFIGVEDKTNKVIGFDRKNADNERNYFNNQLNEHISPRPHIEISFLPYFVRENERYVIKITVHESEVKPVILKYKGVPSIFIRRDGFTGGATYEEIIDMSIKSKNTQFDVLLSDIKYESAKFTKLRAFYKAHNEGRELSDKALYSMGFVNEDGLLLNGAVLFQDDYNGGKTLIQCSVFSGINRGSQRIVTINRFSGNILDSIQFVMDFVNQRMNHSIVKKDNQRINIDAFPQRALFEAVVNAIVHRDYFIDGTQIQVDMFRDRLEISSPGSFYRGEKIEKTYELSKIISKRRNELISNVLVACNVMEAVGTGFDKIAEEYSNSDENHKPYIYSTSDHFCLVLPDLTNDVGIVDGINPSVEYVPIANGTKFDEQVLSYCFYSFRSALEIAQHIGVSDSSFFRHKVLDNLVASGYLHRTKKSRTNYYMTNREEVKLRE